MKLVPWTKSSVITWIGVCVIGGLLAGVVFYLIQKAQASEFKAYQLSHVQADQIQSTLQAILPEGTELLIDSQKNRILLSGSDQAHQIVQQALASLDRSPPSLTPKPDYREKASPSTQPVVAAYLCPEGTAQSTANRLRTQWGNNPDVRIVADPRTSQVLVLAPPEIQREIAAQLDQRGLASSTGGAISGKWSEHALAASQIPQTTQFSQSTKAISPNSNSSGTSGVKPVETPSGGQSVRPASPPASQVAAGGAASHRQTVQLWQTNARVVESALVEMLGSRMEPISPGQYRLHVSGGRELTLQFDPQTDRIVVEGTASAVEASVRLFHALDLPADKEGVQTRVVPLSSAGSEHFQRAVRAIQTSQKLPGIQNTSDTEIGQEKADGESGQLGKETSPKIESSPALAQAAIAGGTAPEAGAPAGPEPAAPSPGPTPPSGPGAPITPAGPAPGGPQPPAPEPAAQPGAEAVQPDQPPAEKPAVMGPVQVQLLEGLDVLVIRGLRRDVEQVLSVIQQIEQLAKVTEPVIEIYQLRYVDCEAVASLVQQLYTAIYEPRQGIVSVTALVKPNALLLIGPRGNVDKVLNLVRKLDKPVPPETQFRVFRLKHAPAQTVQSQIQQFYAQRGGLGVRVIVTSDFRSNSLVVMARPRDMVEIAALIERLDTDTAEAEHEIRVFKLQNTLAEDLAPIIQSAIGAGQAPAPAPGQAAPAAQAGAPETKSTVLSFITLDAQGRRLLKSGILTGVRVTADPRSNSLVVSAPAQTMPLLEALIKQLDVLPAAEAQIKVFTIVNGDASSLAEMLQALFGTAQAAPATAGVQLQQMAVEGESSLVPLRFAVDVRTNSIIAVGTPGFLNVVEAILLRLDEAEVRARKSLVYRLRNAPAADVANALNEFLRSERQVQQVAPGLVSAFEQIEREVVVVPEIVSNSLIVSATPRFYDEIVRLIEDLDKRPPMVLIQVLIAEVTLNNVDEFGVELGLQDPILFDRSVLSNVVTRSVTTTLPTGAQTTTQEIISANIEPGFNFNNQPLGNSGATKAIEHADVIGTQGLSHFGLGRLNSELGFGGLVLSASSESVSILLRALKDSRRMDILARPQLMTLDNQPAFIQVGQEVPTIRGVTITETGQVNNIEYASVGLILGVTPRISPDGLVVMEIDAVKSEVGPEAEGIPISISATGDVIRSPRINTTRAQTTVSALNGQTIVLGGLITRTGSKVHRRVPVLSDIPVVGNLFRYDYVAGKRTELLIIMTPHIVNNEQDADRVRQLEAARMSWCLGDVVAIHGDAGLRGRSDDWGDDEVPTVYPVLSPTADRLPACRARLRSLRERASRCVFPQNRLEPRRDLAPMASACDGPGCRPAPLAQLPRQPASHSEELLPDHLPRQLTPAPTLPTPSGQLPEPEVVPTPPPEPMSTAPTLQQEGFSASATEFLPQGKTRPWEKLRARLTRKNSSGTPTTLPDGTIVIEKPLLPHQPTAESTINKP
ncbi:MAG: hypothetical protein NZ602_05110 [Thermoguttaceae bacterium]|nr:hypothetical protein [Thermoguttaceae bacterium]MDW8039055.1 secretin N-terminal domain-containing protein [Thermoguttaceae bacterium]